MTLREAIREAVREAIEETAARGDSWKRDETRGLTLAEAAQALTISETLLKQMIRAGEVRVVKVRRRTVVPASEVRKLLTPAPRLQVSKPLKGRAAKARAKEMADRLRRH